MKKHLAIYAALLVILAAFTSCSPSNTAGLGISRERGSMSFKIFQTLDNGEALANPTSSSVDVAKIVSLEELYYDGKVVGGYFILIDTFKYQTRNGDIKTVPVFIKQKEYKKWKLLHSSAKRTSLTL